jgi:hypothetical protein
VHLYKNLTLATNRKRSERELADLTVILTISVF